VRLAARTRGREMKPAKAGVKASPMSQFQKFVSECRYDYPDRQADIENFLKPFKLADGRLQHNDEIIQGLVELKKGWKRKRG
jgi:hypothetical protein